jgi:hypothetical protein
VLRTDHEEETDHEAVAHLRMEELAERMEKRMQAQLERAEEEVAIARYEAAKPDTRAWLDSVVAERMRGQRTWAMDRVRRDVFLDWQQGRLRAPRNEGRTA